MRAPRYQPTGEYNCDRGRPRHVTSNNHPVSVSSLQCTTAIEDQKSALSALGFDDGGLHCSPSRSRWRRRASSHSQTNLHSRFASLSRQASNCLLRMVCVGLAHSRDQGCVTTPPCARIKYEKVPWSLLSVFPLKTTSHYVCCLGSNHGPLGHWQEESSG